MGHDRWLWHRYPYRLHQFNNAFDGQPKERGKHVVMTGIKVVARGMEYQWWIGKGN
jgi:hypothetical protein